MLRSCIIVLLTIVLAGFAVDDWGRVSDDDFGFSVEFPVSAERRDETQEIDGGITLEKRIYEANVGGGTYLVSCARYPRLYFEVIDPDEYLEAAILRTGWQVISAEVVHLGEHPGRKYRIKVTPDSPVSDHTMYVVKNRVFQLGAITFPWADTNTHIDAERFMSSFQLKR